MQERGKKLSQKNKEPIILIVSSPSGGGKTTIVSRLISMVPGIKRSVSYTTRKPREGEQDGEDYIFVSEESFNDKIAQKELLEWEKNFGYLYGTSEKQVRETLEGGNDVVLSIDVKGARRVKQKFPQSISVFIMPPSVDELTERLRDRNTEKREELDIRLKESSREIEESESYDYLIMNEDLDKAVEELRTIVESERKNREEK